MWSLLVLLSAAPAAAQPSCGLSAHLGAGLPVPPVQAVSSARGKQTRDLYGVPNAIETKNFVVRWGDAGAVVPADAQALAVALEAVWAAEVERLGHPPPLTATWFKLNVYIGDSGSGAPSSLDSAGYYWYDEEYYPMLVLSWLTVSDPEYARAVAAHEFFHGVQAAYATYTFGEVDFWYWEATATWITSAVFPGNPHYASLLFGQAFQPEHSINGYFYGQEGVLSYHPYGAFLFVTWLTEVAADPALVRRSWAEAPVGGDPIVVIDELLAEAGWSLADAFADFARRNATWDYADGAIYAASIETSGGWAVPSSSRPAGSLTGSTGGWIAPSGPLPHTLGASYWQVAGLSEDMTIAIETEGTADWRAWLAGRDAAGGHVYTALATDGAPHPLPAIGTWTEAWLVVAAVEGLHDAGEVGTYRLQIATPEGEGPTDSAAPDTDASTEHPSSKQPTASRGCASSPATGGLGLLLPLVVRQRRRTRARATRRTV